MASTCVLVLLDGLGDCSCKELDDRTPLQAASTPNLDYLASIGGNGLFHAQEIGMALPSENMPFHSLVTPGAVPGAGLFGGIRGRCPGEKTRCGFAGPFCKSD